MRTIFYTDEQIESARNKYVPALRQYADDCRAANPLPDLDSLTAAEQAQHEIFTDKMTNHGPPFRSSHGGIGILHSSLVGLLAAQHAFQIHLDKIVLLTAQEKVAWFDELDTEVDGWYWCWWWTIHTEIPNRYKNAIARDFATPNGFDYWLFTCGQGGSAITDLWSWNGAAANIVMPMFSAACCEEGWPPEWYK